MASDNEDPLGVFLSDEKLPPEVRIELRDLSERAKSMSPEELEAELREKEEALQQSRDQDPALFASVEVLGHFYDKSS